MKTTTKPKAKTSAAKPRKAEVTIPATPNPDKWPEWAETAYRLHARGQRNMTTLSRQFGVKWETCRDWIRKVGLFMAEQELHAQEYALAEYAAGLEEILGQAQTTYAHTDNDNAKIGALRVAGDMLEKLAAARGVVTQRKADELTGPGGGPLIWWEAVKNVQGGDPGGNAGSSGDPLPEA